MKWFFHIILVLLLAVSCNSGNTTPEHVRVAGKLRAKIAKKLAKKHQMSISGSGGRMMHQVSEIAISFDLDRPLTREEARKLIISCMEEFLHTINENEGIRPFISQYPFQPENIQISIFSHHKNFQPFYDPLISVVSTVAGDVCYRTNGPEDEYRHKSVTEESYEEALEIVKQQAPELLPHSTPETKAL